MLEPVAVRTAGKGPVQSPRPEFSMPTGSWMTPSSEMYCETMILEVIVVSYGSVDGTRHHVLPLLGRTCLAAADNT